MLTFTTHSPEETIALGVRIGNKLKKGDVIGKVGNTAKSESSDGAHLHLEVWLDDENVDPSIYLDLENK